MKRTSFALLAVLVSLTGTTACTMPQLIWEEEWPTLAPLATRTPKFSSTTTSESGSIPSGHNPVNAGLQKEIATALEKSGSQAGQGRLVWADASTITLEANGYDEVTYWEVPDVQEIASFAFHSKITWTTELGFSGCGFNFRLGDGDRSRGKYYMFYFNRLSGAPYYLINSFDSGTWMRRVGEGYSGVIKDEQYAENELLFIAQGEEYQIFFNDKRVNVLYDASILNGQFELLTYGNTGAVTCEFNDTWIWTWDK